MKPRSIRIILPGILIALSTLSWKATGQSMSDSLRTLRQRRTAIWALEGSFTAGTFVFLNQAWYTQYDRVGFHLFDDWGEWMQMDKAGHALSTYAGSRVAADCWRWAGLDRRKAAWTASLSSMGYLTMVEMLDGFSEKWGFSPGDMIFNTAGTALFLSQELSWGEQRIAMKLSYRPVAYDVTLRERTESLFGRSPAERFLKDYNGQTIWLSANIRSFLPSARVPAWLNIAVGHGVRTMLGGRENVWEDDNGITTDRSDVLRYRRFFLSLDIDLSRIPVKNRFLRSALSVVNIVKIPAPALEIDGRGRIRGHLLHF
jgi:hypothetical protein